MKLWRISKHADLSGLGGLKAGGRWHSKGTPVVYLAESTALAMLEVLVHLDPDEIPDSFVLLEIDLSLKIVMRLSKHALPDGWECNTALTRSIGDNWLKNGKSAFQKVPSAIAPNSYNYLMNPANKNSKLATVVKQTTHPFDSRLF